MKKNDCNCNCNHEPEYRYYFFDSSPTDVKFTQRDGRIGGIQLLILAIMMLIWLVTR